MYGPADIVSSVVYTAPDPNCVQRRGSAPGSAQALEFAPETLARSALSANQRHPLPPDLRDDRRTVVHVAGHGDGGPDARLDRPDDLDDALAIGDERLDP